MVYLGDSLALAGMELLVHLRAEQALQAYRKMPVFIPERLVMHLGEDQLPPEWEQPSLHPVTQEFGDRWIDHALSAVLQVPSAVVRGETNFIVNPDHANFGAITTGPISRFRYDPRLAR